MAPLTVFVVFVVAFTSASRQRFNAQKALRDGRGQGNPLFGGPIALPDPKGLGAEQERLNESSALAAPIYSFGTEANANLNNFLKIQAGRAQFSKFGPVVREGQGEPQRDNNRTVPEEKEQPNSNKKGALEDGAIMTNEGEGMQPNEKEAQLKKRPQSTSSANTQHQSTRGWNLLKETGAPSPFSQTTTVSMADLARLPSVRRSDASPHLPLARRSNAPPRTLSASKVVPKQAPLYNISGLKESDPDRFASGILIQSEKVRDRRYLRSQRADPLEPEVVKKILERKVGEAYNHEEMLNIAEHLQGNTQLIDNKWADRVWNVDKAEFTRECLNLIPRRFFNQGKVRTLLTSAGVIINGDVLTIEIDEDGSPRNLLDVISSSQFMLALHVGLKVVKKCLIESYLIPLAYKSLPKDDEIELQNLTLLFSEQLTSALAAWAESTYLALIFYTRQCGRKRQFVSYNGRKDATMCVGQFEMTMGPLGLDFGQFCPGKILELRVLPRMCSTEDLEAVFARANEWSLEPEIICNHLTRNPNDKYNFVKFSKGAIDMLNKKMIRELGGEKEIKKVVLRVIGFTENIHNTGTAVNKAKKDNVIKESQIEARAANLERFKMRREAEEKKKVMDIKRLQQLAPKRSLPKQQPSTNVAFRTDTAAQPAKRKRDEPQDMDVRKRFRKDDKDRR